MNYTSIPSGLLLFEKRFEREFRQSKPNVLSPLFMSIYRHLCHLPGSWECYKKPYFHHGPAWDREACVQGRSFMKSCVPNWMQRKSSVKDLVMQKSFKPQVGFWECCQGGDATAIISLDSSFKCKENYVSWQRWNLLHDYRGFWP